MSKALRCLGALARQAVNQTEEQGIAVLGTVQKRCMTSGRYSPRQFSKDKPVDLSVLWWQKNPYVEALYWRRDRLEREFAWNHRNTFELTYFIGGITALLYGLSLFGIRSADRQSGYPKRNFVFHPTENTFVNPDERDFY